MEKKMEIYLKQNIKGRKNGKIRYGLAELRDRVKACEGWLDRMADDDAKTDYENLGEKVYNIDWFQNEVMRLYQASIDFNRTLVEANTMARIIEEEKMLEE
jgi:hypothetical protein